MSPDHISKTAAFVAIKFYGLTRYKRFRSLFDESEITFYERLVQSLPKPLSYYQYWLQFKWVRRFYISSEELLLPGDLLHIIARKWYMQRMVNQLVNEGYEQIIVLGAGFDHLGYHFSKVGISCFEIDRPKMGRLKQQFFQKYYPDQPYPHIITNDQSSIPLPHQKIDPDKKTIVAAEGFFDYLTPHSVEEMLNKIRNNFSHSTALICTHFALDELPFLHRFVYKTSVRLVGEQLRFHTPAEAFKQMLKEQRYEIRQFFDTQEISKTIHDQIDTTLPLLKGFHILSAETSSGSCNK